MSNIERSENLKQIVKMVEPDFNSLAKIHNAVHYAREASFALQALNDNSYLAQIAMSDQDSLKRAVVNVAAIGLSLNPVQKLAYLVPRDKKVSLDISYRGYLQLAQEVGAIMWAQAEVVYEKDIFQLQGFGKEPKHTFSPFDKNRGPIVGAYCVAKLPNGDFLTTHMSIAEIYSIRDRSVSWRAHVKDGKSTPWATDENEMIKKTVIKRASKTWPSTDGRERLEKAIDVTNDLEIETLPPTTEVSERTKHFETIRAQLAILGRTEEAYLQHLQRVHQREIKSLDNLTDLEIQKELISLKQWVDAHNLKNAKPAESAGK